METVKKDNNSNSDNLATIETRDTSASDIVGHAPELERNFGTLSLIGLGLVVGNVWPASGGTILVAIFNGGPPGQCSPIRKGTLQQTY